MSKISKESKNYQEQLAQKLLGITSSNVIKLYYENANEFVNSLLDKYRDTTYFDKKCPFSCIYGVTLSGCVQKQLVVSNISCGYLVFLYHLKEKHFDESTINLCPEKHANIFQWIKKCIEKVKKETCNKTIEVLEHSKHSLKIKWKGLGYHIAIAWTFSKRQYCEFHYTQQNVHVYPFSSEQLQMAANDLIDEAPIHQRLIVRTSKENNIVRKCFEKSMNASLSLLRVYYMREELVEKNTQSAILFLKVWQHVAIKEKFSNSSLEIICVYIFDQLKKRSSNPISSFDIIQEFFKLITELKSAKETKMIEWPYRQNHFQYQKKNFVYNAVGNLETKLEKSKDLFYACEGSLAIINSNKISGFMKYIFESLKLKDKEVKDKEAKDNWGIEDILYLAPRASSENDSVKVDRSALLAKELVEHCFYELKDRKHALPMRDILNNCKELYDSYHLELCFVLTHWESVKTRIERYIKMRWGDKEKYVWTKDENDKNSKDEPAALESFFESLKKYHKEDPTEREARNDDEDIDRNSDSKSSFVVSSFASIFYYVIAISKYIG
ncbi:hypothetical protein RFI_19617 [Reticulomyxa filosa]|uniref:Uncharacterized protein n=1 Tax=Reticulomyxa filosa TaxID=46433 RepID=X6MVM0_RETFI|nr:hypothetical protein RFI_19617 [Reticulomyxa filosa]|eukprot:ETO17696.1 hypothetical protein RFI_19617 [Reticulomyxa filosa]